VSRYAEDLLFDITRGFELLTDSPEKTNLIVLLLHDVTGQKKKAIRELLKYGKKLEEIYAQDQDFSVNKRPEAKISVKTQTKRKKA
jgi:hypothetical protein